jgi:hypothetical protein
MELVVAFFTLVQSNCREAVLLEEREFSMVYTYMVMN